MHAVMRRMPAERARHAKRLGHAGAPGPAVFLAENTTTSVSQVSSQPQTTTTTTSQTTSTSVSTTKSSSSASASSASQPSSSSSAATLSASTSTSAAPASAPSSAPTLPSSSPIVQSTLLISISPSSSPTSTPQTNTTAATSSGLSGSAIAGIIAGSVVVGVALIVFFVRKTYLRRRERRRISWNDAPGLGAGIPDEPKFPDISEELVSNTPPQRAVPISPFEAHRQPTYSTPVPPAARMQPPGISSFIPMPPPTTYNNPVAAYPTQPVSSAYNPANAAAFPMRRASAQQAQVEAIVKCTFVPNLPDELSITTGERVFIVEEYDDGWNLCANGRGERGMVPRECLERATSDPGIGWRDARRISSLNPDGNRY